jgi:hypothetical protein
MNLILDVEIRTPMTYLGSALVFDDRQYRMVIVKVDCDQFLVLIDEIAVR